MILDIQRAGPSTGMPTKPEQADLLMVLYGRNGESPVPGRRRLEPVAVLRRGDRGGAHRAQVPHARVPALRRLPRERLGAVADPGRRRRCPTSRRPFARAGRRRRSSRTCATPRRSRARGRSRDARARAPDRRAREGGRDRERSPTTRTTTTTWSGCARRRWPASRPTSPSSRSTTPTATPSCSSSAGARPTARSARRSGASASAGVKVAHAHLHHLNPFPRNTGDVLQRYRRCSSRR